MYSIQKMQSNMKFFTNIEIANYELKSLLKNTFCLKKSFDIKNDKYEHNEHIMNTK